MLFHIHTYGCQMNEADSEAMAGALIAAGHAPTPDLEEADLLLLNTCCVREKPERKAYGRLGELRLLKARRPGLVIAVAGCLAQKEGEGILRRAPFVDLVVGTRQFHRLPELVAEVRTERGPKTALSLEDDPCRVTAPEAPTRAETASLKKFVPVILGCDNFCSYCIVPRVRGREQSRPLPEVGAEVEAAAAQGVREVTLLGQNVLAYGRDLSPRVDFCDLLEAIHDVAGLERIRFITCHPRDVSQRLMRTIAALPKVCEHLHLPAQAGEDRLLRDMGRGYSTAYYEDLVARLRAAIPGLAITTDLMVGFPGETEDEFEASLAFCGRIRFDQAFTFAYCPRPGTPAAARSDQVPPEVGQRRLARLIEMQNRISEEINRCQLGRTVEVLADGFSKKNPARLTGRTRGNKLVLLGAEPALIGQLCQARLTQAHPWGFHGEIA
jgi:tRNA-2-methylthio-N6-dimethylallyladenosine synthase